MDIHFVSILCPHVHGHEMDVHRISDFGHPLMTDIWTFIENPVLDLYSYIIIVDSYI